MRDLTLFIEGMSCGHCLQAVNQALGMVAGVEIGSVRIGRADLRYDESVVAPGRIVEAVTSAGYPATVAP